MQRSKDGDPGNRAECQPEVRSWYREPWVVFVVALPASAVIAGLVTWAIAARGTDVPAPARPQAAASASQLAAQANGAGSWGA